MEISKAVTAVAQRGNTVTRRVPVKRVGITQYYGVISMAS